MHARGVLALSLATVLFPALVRAQAPSPSPVNVGDLLRLATENNRELSALRQRLPEARGLLRQAGTRPAPTLEFSGTTGRPLATVGEILGVIAFEPRDLTVAFEREYVSRHTV